MMTTARPTLLLFLLLLAHATAEGPRIGDDANAITKAIQPFMTAAAQDSSGEAKLTAADRAATASPLADALRTAVDHVDKYWNAGKKITAVLMREDVGAPGICPSGTRESCKKGPCAVPWCALGQGRKRWSKLGPKLRWLAQFGTSHANSAPGAEARKLVAAWQEEASEEARRLWVMRNEEAKSLATVKVLGAGTKGVGWGDIQGGGRTTQVSQNTAAGSLFGGEAQSQASVGRSTNLCAFASSNYVAALCAGRRTPTTFPELLQDFAAFRAHIVKQSGDGMKCANDSPHCTELIFEWKTGMHVTEVDFDRDTAKQEIDAGRPIMIKLYRTGLWSPWTVVDHGQTTHATVLDGYAEGKTVVNGVETDALFFRVVDSQAARQGTVFNAAFTSLVHEVNPEFERLPVWVPAAVLEATLQTGDKEDVSVQTGRSYLGMRMDQVHMWIVDEADRSKCVHNSDGDGSFTGSSGFAADAKAQCARLGLEDDEEFVDRNGWSCAQFDADSSSSKPAACTEARAEADGYEFDPEVSVKCKCACHDDKEEENNTEEVPEKTRSTRQQLRVQQQQQQQTLEAGGGVAAAAADMQTTAEKQDAAGAPRVVARQPKRRPVLQRSSRGSVGKTAANLADQAQRSAAAQKRLAEND